MHERGTSILTKHLVALLALRLLSYLFQFAEGSMEGGHVRSGNKTRCLPEASR